ncbi:MAG: SPOR domain-containing protein [Deltaproteobacteria bacterium]|nr:SPOR domain-containing protein [Deltaproteobacteria bacterium]
MRVMPRKFHCLTLILLLALVPACGKKKDKGDSEVISKRVKIELKDAAAPAEGSAATEIQPAQEAATPASRPAPAPVVLEQKKPEKKVVAEAPAKPAIKIDLQDNKEKKTAQKAPSGEKAAAKKAPAKADAKKIEKKTLSKPWALNLASFPDMRSAQALAGKLKKAGYDAYITDFTKKGVKWHRVRVGFYSTKKEALSAAKTMEKKFGIRNPWTVKPEKDELLAKARGQV